MIFVHEAGHFLAARLIGVRVEVFSLGFGPKLFGFRRKGTLYQVAAIPMGGFVAVAGEDPGVRDPRPDELPSKSVGQRFLYYSGGVLMNVAFAIVVLPLVFLHGVLFVKPVLGEPIPGGPAWHAGLPAGAEVLEVNGAAVYDFMHVPTAVALGPTEGSRLRVRLPGGEESEITVVPEKRPELGLFSIDVRPALDPDGTLEVAEGSAAARAGLVSGDRLVAIVGYPPELSLREQIALAGASGGAVELIVRGADEGAAERRVTVEPDLSARSRPRVGIAPPFHEVETLRATERARLTDLRPGDRVLAVEGAPVWRSGDFPLAVYGAVPPGERRALTLSVERDGRTRAITWPAWSREELALALGDIAWTQAQGSSRIAVYAGEAGARAGLADGDVVVAIDGEPVEAWADVEQAVKAAAGEELRFEVRRDGSTEPIVVSVRAEPAALASYGFAPQTWSYVYRTDGVAQAVAVGMASSVRFLEEVWLSLQKLVMREVPADSLGGIISIGVVSYSWLEAGVAKLLFFLCLLSINLAFINVLPIPVLDGGHLFFLGIEAVKGSPVSEKVFGYSQMVGLVLIVTLMVYVTFNDLVRWVL